ncbi:MAG: DUF167 domain-containing protein [Actinomycetota bacterium]
MRPGSRAGDRVVEELDGSIVVHLRARPIDGAANAALLRVLADHWGLPPSALAIVRGHRSRRKVVRRP